MPSQGMRFVRRFLAAVVGLGSWLTPLAAQGPPPPSRPEEPATPPHYAIQGARVVTTAGEVLESATVVVSEGLVAAVGADIEVPTEARILDGAGLTVYPGLIDAFGDLGLKSGGVRGGNSGRGGPPGAGRPGGGRGEGGAQPPYSAGPEDRPGTTPWKTAAEELKADDGRIASWRRAGFTSAVTAPGTGIFPGQAAFINLAGEPGEMVVKTPAALSIQLESPGGYRGYPGSLMGRIAYVRQLYLDAEQYASAREIYDASPKGLRRPAWDRSLEPLVEARREGWPVLIPGVWAKEIHRAESLGEDIGARTTVVVGAHQGYAVADALADGDVAVLVSVNWPEKSEDADPDGRGGPARVTDARRRALDSGRPPRRRRAVRVLFRRPRRSRRGVGPGAPGDRRRALGGSGLGRPDPGTGTPLRRRRSARLDRGGQDRQSGRDRRWPL